MPRLAGGYEGDGLPKSYPVPYDITNYFLKGKTAWTDSAVPAVSAQQVSDAKVTLTPTSMILQMNITDEMIDHATDKRIRDYIIGKLSKAATRTMESMIINGDAETGASGNVNSDDQAPATTFSTTGGASDHRILLDHGIRESAINNSNTLDVSGFDSDDIMSVINKLDPRYVQMRDELLIVSEPQTYNSILVDDALKLLANTSRATIDGGAPKPYGVELLVSDLVPKTEADGKMAGITPANNTLGQFIVFHKEAVRHGFGQGVNIEVTRVAGYGYTLTLTLEWGFVVVDAANTCAAGINVTLI